MQHFATYKYSLLTLAHFLHSVGEQRWSTRLCRWVRELDSATDDENVLRAHMVRTRRALNGMDSLRDVSISHCDGLAKTHPENLLPVLKRRFFTLLASLDELTAGGLVGRVDGKRAGGR